MPTSKTSEQRDVCILGGGMAGLTLARQLKQRQPRLDVAVLEHQQFPVAQAAHKVGESTVEIASHYLQNQLQMHAHLAECQLPKFGLRLFFRGDQAITDDLSRYDEMGGSKILPIETYQLDRGRFENYLAEAVRGDGVRLYDHSTVRRVDLQPGQHQVTYRDAATGTERRMQSRFLVDASGRRAWLRKGGDLTRPARHKNHAVWFRIAATVDIETWSKDSAWLTRCPGAPRHLSTNHFTGPGYWVWLIPLSSGATSVGVVFDPKLLDPKLVRHHDKLMAWLAGEHPLVAAALSSHAALDFHYLENYAVTSSQVFSDAGWMATGDAGLFSDPLYSPGGDFIAIANGYITELIAGNNQRPEDFAASQALFLAFFTNTLSLYRGQYGGLGNGDFMVAKTLWDFAYYWAVMSKLYYSEKYTDLAFMRSVRPQLLRASALNSGLQRRFRVVARQQARVGGAGRFYDYWAVPWFHELKADLMHGDQANTAGKLASNIDELSRFGAHIEHLLNLHANQQPLADLDRTPLPHA